MDKLKTLDEVLYSVKEHTRAIKEFKHDKSMRYNNTNNKEKKQKIIEEIQDIEYIMTLIHAGFMSKYKRFAGSKVDYKKLLSLKRYIDEFHIEIVSLR